ncbi:MAG: hypothetical protein HC848_01835 [Limnobacter sp.]|nr:hypothetical protein [Limnobacter sp.]
MSLSLPLTWTGRQGDWSWRVRGSVGDSSSHEDAAELYPLASAPGQFLNSRVAQVNPADLTNAGGNGGGDSYSFSVQLEHQFSKHLIGGLSFSIDRSQDYSPDLFQLYIKSSLWEVLTLAVPPQGLIPYSRF